GVVNRAHLDYAERIWEEFTQSIHTFIEDQRNPAQHTHGKKKATLIVIPSIRFTKLIIYHLQRKHKFYPRLDSPLHLPNEEPVLGYLKFNAKGTKREVFWMPIPGSLITTNIQGASYYQEYLEKVAKHQRYLTGETGSDPDSPAPKPTKTAKKPKPTAPKADPRPPVSKPASSKQPEPKPAPAKTQGKKRKLEPSVDNEEADVQRALEESLKSMYDVPRGPLPPVVIRELESEKYQPLPEVPGKGKKKVTEEQVARDILTLQTPKKKTPADRYIFQRRTSTPTGSSGHDESSSLYAKLGLTDSEEETDEDVLGTDAGIQGEGQAGQDPDAQDEGQAGSNPDEQAEGQARPGPGDAEASQPLPSLVVHAGSDLEHMDLDVADVSTQPLPEQMDEGFNAMAYPKVSKAVAKVVTDAVDWAMQTPLWNRFRDLPEADMKEILHQRMWETDSYKTYEDHMQLYEALEKSMNRDHSEELAKDLAEARKKKKKSRDSPKTPPGSPPHQPPAPHPLAGPSGASGSSEASGSSKVPPPPPPPLSTNQEGQSKGSAAPSSSKTAAAAEYQAWMTTDTRLRPSISMTLADLQMDDDMAPNSQAQPFDDEDIGNAHIPKNNWASTLASTYSPPPEDSLLAHTGDIAMFMDWFLSNGRSHKLPIDSVDDSILRHNVSKPLPLGGPPGQVTIQSDFFFNKDLEYLRYGSKGSRPALFISKMKVAYYPDAGLKQMVPDQMWIEEECKHTSEGDRTAVTTHIRILSIVRIEVFSMYGYDYMKKIVLHRADLNEHVIAEQDLKYLYPSDFEDLYLLNLQAWIHPINLELLDPVVQCLINLLQRAITELVDLIEAHNHLNPIYILKREGPWRIDYYVVILVFEARGIPSRFGEVELSLVALNP
nr:hypothetical protein [Tanacetum cinerariifolium]GEZ76494.1 hypothetical protein [Tanacetum cinerariifolium]